MRFQSSMSPLTVYHQAVFFFSQRIRLVLDLAFSFLASAEENINFIFVYVYDVSEL